MLFPSTNTWNDLKKLEGLLFYVLRLQELSYDQSDFIEKNISTPVTALIAELRQVIEIIEKGTVKGQEKELSILKEELKDKISTDLVSKKLLGEKLERYISCLDSDSTDEIKLTLELIYLKLSPRKYWRELKYQIGEIVKNGKQKDKILNIANLTFEFLIEFGYEKGTIYHFINLIFFDKSRQNKVTELDDVNLFLNKFDLKKREYEVYFVCSTLFMDIKDSCESFNIEIKTSGQHLYNKSLENAFFKNYDKKKAFIKCKRIMAYDYINAMTVAEEQVSLISDLFVLFHHKKKPWFSDYCLIYNHKKNHVIKSNFSFNSMSKLNESSIEHAKEIFPIFLKNFGLRRESFKRFNRGVELHAHSLETNEPSSQILNLWICLEAILITGKGTHISSVESAVKIIVGNFYLKERLTNLNDLLMKWNKTKYTEVKDKLPSEWKEDEDMAVLALVGLKQYENLAMELLKEMDSTPLLRFKFMMLVRDYQDPNRILQLYESREKRTIYDIRRVYRTRNKIVHQGALSKKATTIVEIAHFYLDTVMNAIIYTSLVNDDINSIDNFLFEQNLFQTEHRAILNSAKKSNITLDNIKAVSFGPDS